MRNRIRELRKAKGWSQEELARRVHSSGQSISKIETGETRINEDWMERLGRAFGVPPEDLLGAGLDQELLHEVLVCVYELAAIETNGLPPAAFAQVVMLAYDQARLVEDPKIRAHVIPAIVKALVAQCRPAPLPK